MTSHHDSIQRFAQRLEDLDYKLDRLESRLQDLGGEVRERAAEKLARLKAVGLALRQREQAIKDASEAALHELEAGAEEAWSTAKVLFEDLSIDMKVEGL